MIELKNKILHPGFACLRYVYLVMFIILGSLVVPGNNLYGNELNLKNILISGEADTKAAPESSTNIVQQFTITGTVVDNTGLPLPGANVLEKGAANGTQTDFDGEFSLTVSDENAVLVVSFVGFVTAEIEVEDQKTLKITLINDAAALDEIVVVGYGTQKKKDLTGSVTSINMDDIPSSSNVNLAQALRGVTAGLNVEGGSSAGSEPSFSIRRQTSLSASTRPLIVLDGIIFNGAISDINIADVQQINVLKGASAAAVYGSRSANGVVLITTKKGKRGEGPRVNFSTYYGVQDYTNHPVEMMNAEQYSRRLVDFNYFQSLYNWYRKIPTGPDDQGGKPAHPGYEEQSVLAVLKSEDERKNYLAGNEIDWIDEVTRLAPMSNHDLSISGGGDGFSYYVSGSFTDQKGVQLGDSFKRTTLNSRVEGDLVDWITEGWAPVVQATITNPNQGGGGAVHTDFYAMRLAETYLLRAEAFLGMGDKVSAAADINMIRNRANATPVSPGDLDMDYILDERIRELYMEEFRTITLMRTGKLIERTRKYRQPNVARCKYTKLS